MDLKGNRYSTTLQYGDSNTAEQQGERTKKDQPPKAFFFKNQKNKTLFCMDLSET